MGQKWGRPSPGGAKKMLRHVLPSCSEGALMGAFISVSCSPRTSRPGLKYAAPPELDCGCSIPSGRPKERLLRRLFDPDIQDRIRRTLIYETRSSFPLRCLRPQRLMIFLNSPSPTSTHRSSCLDHPEEHSSHAHRISQSGHAHACKPRTSVRLGGASSGNRNCAG
jgi:hypothetical protein